jgi:hypothetical protein
MNIANIRNHAFAGALLLCLAVSACGKKSEPAPPAPPKAEASGKSAKSAERPPEPTEAEIRELIAASVEETNRQGGIVLAVTATGKKSEPIKVRLDGYQKDKCSPYTKAWRCEGKVSLSYPGSNFPAETLRHSRRFQKNEHGRWTMD